MSGHGLVAGIDIGGTQTRAMLVSPDGSVRGHFETDTGLGGDRTVGRALECLDKALASAGQSRDSLDAVGVGIPGHVDVSTGEVRRAVNLDLGETPYPIGARLSSELYVPLIVEHDMRLAALGAFERLSLTRDLDHLAFLGIGTGISVGLILNRAVFRGSSGFAGEVGHIVVEPNGAPCRCGVRGCLEAVAGGPAVARSGSTMAALLSAESHDSKAHGVVENLTGHIAWAIHLVMVTYDPEVVVLGGGVASAGSLLLNRVRANLEQLIDSSSAVDPDLLGDRLVTVPTDFNPGVWGAVSMARRLIENETTNQPRRD